MGHPVRLQLSRRKGFDLQALSLATNGLPAVSVARPGPFGNPFAVGKCGVTNAAYAVDLHRKMLAGYFALGRGPTIDEQRHSVDRTMARLSELHGKNVACFCRLDRPCHGDVLLRLAAPSKT